LGQLLAKISWAVKRVLNSWVSVLQYQNCAPAAGTAASASSQSGSPSAISSGSALPDSSHPVSVIDSPSGGLSGGLNVAFKQSDVVLHSQVQSVTLVGDCPADQEGAVFQWQIHSGSGVELAHGPATCSAQKFTLDLAPTQDLQCDQSYKVTARIGLGQEAQMNLQRRCVAEASHTATTTALPAALKLGSRCSFEKREAGSGPSCSLACYSGSGILESAQAVDLALCP
jgi:hypothetical protein